MNFTIYLDSTKRSSPAVHPVDRQAQHRRCVPCTRTCEAAALELEPTGRLKCACGFLLPWCGILDMSSSAAVRCGRLNISFSLISISQPLKYPQRALFDFLSSPIQPVTIAPLFFGIIPHLVGVSIGQEHHFLTSCASSKSKTPPFSDPAVEPKPS